MAKVVACIIARTVSKRLPLKVLRDVYPGISMIDFLISRIKEVKEIDEIYLCTSTESVDDILEDIAFRNRIKIYRGSAEMVIERMLAVGEMENADVLLRITGDNPLTATEYIPLQLSMLVNKNLDYVRVVDVPIGATAELMTRKALIKCNQLMDPMMSEYLMLYLFDPKNFKCGVVKPFKTDFGSYSVTVDTPEDFARARNILAELDWRPNLIISFSKIVEIFEDNNIQLSGKIIKSGGDIKLPYGKTISIEAFKEDMNNRIINSEIVRLYE
jgi:spore coat polysaccharide biosynthesis protein SpsF